MKNPIQNYFPYVVVGFVSLFALAFLDNSRGPFFQDIISDLALKDSVASLMFVATSFMSFCLGKIVPRVLAGHIRLLNLVRLGHLAMACGFAWLSQVQSLAELIVAAAAFGIGYGIINVTQNILIVEGTAPALRRRILSGLHSIYALSSLVAPLVISFLIEDNLTWRQVFLGFAVLPLLAFVATFFARQQTPQAIETQLSPDITHMGLKTLLASFGIAFYVVAELLISTRLPIYLQRYSSVPAETAARYLALFFLLLFLGRVVFSVLKLDRYSSRQIMQVSLVLAMIAVLLGLFVSPLWLAFAGLPMAPFFGVSISYVTETFGKNANVALGSALALQALFIVGMHYIIGWVTQMWDIRVAMSITPIFLICSLILLTLGARKTNAGTH